MRIKLFMFSLLIIAGILSLRAKPLPSDLTHDKTTTETDSVTLFFRLNESHIDSLYMGNSKIIDSLKKIASAEILSIAIEASTSPEGSAELNRVLGARRADTLETFVRSIIPAWTAGIEKTFVNYPWSVTRNMVERDPDIPGKKKLLTILDDTLVANEAVRGWKIKILEDGATFSYLKEHILPLLRIGNVTVTVRRAEPAVEQPACPAEPEPLEETPVVCDTVPAVEPDSTTVTRRERRMKKKKERKPYPVALKSNLLFDAIGAPNLGVELPVGKRFSFGAYGAYAYWRIDNTYALQTAQGGIEWRYWFNPSKGVMTGWSTGVYGMYSGRYDAQWKDGYQGDGFWSTGLSAGYSVPLSERFNMEFALAGGYFFTPEARHYHRPSNGHRCLTGRGHHTRLRGRHGAV